MIEKISADDRRGLASRYRPPLFGAERFLTTAIGHVRTEMLQ
jgi:hypothetical protein